MKRRLLVSDNQELGIIPGSSYVHINPQPLKVQRYFELGFTACETHFLMNDGPWNSPPQPNTTLLPKVEDDKEAQLILDECTQDLDNLYKEIEQLEIELHARNP